MAGPGDAAHTPAAHEPSEDAPSEDAVQHDFSLPADADVESGDDEAQPA